MQIKSFGIKCNFKMKITNNLKTKTGFMKEKKSRGGADG